MDLIVSQLRYDCRGYTMPKRLCHQKRWGYHRLYVYRFSGEPAYDDIKGAWRRDTPYAVIHRMAFSQKARGKGIAGIAFDLIERFCLEQGVRNIRVDTDFPNKRMQHILENRALSTAASSSFKAVKNWPTINCCKGRFETFNRSELVAASEDRLKRKRIQKDL